MDRVYRMFLVAAVVLGVLHFLLGAISMCVGIASSIKAVVWMAHRVSPIWSGFAFIITGILGFTSVRRQTSYIIMCFTAFSVVSLVTAVVSIQLLRLGLVIHTTDGKTYQKKHIDALLLVALTAAGTECLVCMVSAFVSCRIAKLAKIEHSKKRDAMFHVEVYNEKEVVVVTKNMSTGKTDKRLIDTSEL